MMLLATCRSGLFAMTLLAAPVDGMPLVCAALLAPHWTIEMDVTQVQEPAAGQADGLLAHVTSAEGCEADLYFAAPVAPIRAGDHLRITGDTQEGLVIIVKVERAVA